MSCPPLLSSVEMEAELSHEPEIVVFSPHLDVDPRDCSGGGENGRLKVEGGDRAVGGDGKKRGKKHHRKFNPDPFDKLASTPLESPVGSGTGHEEDGEEGFFAKLVLTPLVFTSFLLSLFLVDRRNRAYRRAQHPSPPPSSTRTTTPDTTPTRSWLPSLAQWLDPEPYSYFNTASTSTSTSPAEKPSQRRYAIGKKHRAIWGLELNQAFEMRGRVSIVVALALGTVLGVVVGVAVVAGWLWWRGWDV